MQIFCISLGGNHREDLSANMRRDNPQSDAYRCCICGPN
jgi:hypothetical protein